MRSCTWKECSEFKDQLASRGCCNKKLMSQEPHKLQVILFIYFFGFIWNSWIQWREVRFTPNTINPEILLQTIKMEFWENFTEKMFHSNLSIKYVGVVFKLWCNNPNLTKLVQCFLVNWSNVVKVPQKLKIWIYMMCKDYSCRQQLVADLDYLFHSDVPVKWVDVACSILDFIHGGALQWARVSVSWRFDEVCVWQGEGGAVERDSMPRRFFLPAHSCEQKFLCTADRRRGGWRFAERLATHEALSSDPAVSRGVRTLCNVQMWSEDGSDRKMMM